MDKKIGVITHYFDKIGVAIIKLEAELNIGNEIKIKGHDHEFTQKVDSMQVEHENIDKAKKGDMVGIKVEKEAKEKDEVFLV